MSGLPQIDGVTGLNEIGRGGFGVVYRGTETEFGRDVAVKVLMPTLDTRAGQRFERERRAMGAVSDHPNIVTVYRGGLTDHQQPYLVMEYVRGGSLDERLQRQGPYDWREAATIGAKLADALAVAHRAGILHRDVKPGNVFQTESGEPKLGDFGIARLDDGQDSRTGSITASVAHAPPEIVDGQRGDERSDLYSLASTIYALTKGHAPFSRDPDQGLTALLSRVANETPPPLHLEHAADDFERVLMQALSKNPIDRQATVAQFGNDLRRAAAVPVGSAAPLGASTTAVDAPASPTPERGTSPVQMAVMALLALAIAGFGGWGIARAVLGDDDSTQQTTIGTEPTAEADTTPVPDPTTPPSPDPSPEASPEPAESPTAEPTPTATVAPTSIPTPEPIPTIDGSSRGSGLVGNDDFARVSDFSGAISVLVPTEWSFTVQDGSTLPLETQGLEGVRALAVGGSFQQLNGEPETRDLAVSGIYVFGARLGEGANAAAILQVALSFWSDCVSGEQSQIPLTDGLAEYEILQCLRDDGGISGVVVLALIPDSDPQVAVSVFLQYADIADLESLPTVLSSLDIDPTQIPG